MPSAAPLSTSVTLSSPPAGVVKSTSVDTRGPTAPGGGGAASSRTDATAGDLLASRIGASFAGVPVTAFEPGVAASVPSVTVVAIVKLALKFVTGVKMTPASSVFTSAIAPLAVHTPVPATYVDVTAFDVPVDSEPAAGFDS